jgi:hypothetical protein
VERIAGGLDTMVVEAQRENVHWQMSEMGGSWCEAYKPMISEMEESLR